MERTTSNTPVAPLPNPGEGGPVYNGGGTSTGPLPLPMPEVTPPSNNSNIPVIPLPNPGEGGPVDNGGGIPVIPLPNPGEGGPVGNGGGIPVIPLPNPGEGGPVGNGGGIPVIPLPNPGEGGPVFGGGIVIVNRSPVRFLNAAFGYPPFRVLIRNTRVVNWLNYASISGYSRIPAGYQTVTVTGPDGYIYIQKTMLFQSGTPTTVAIINTPSGLDLLQITDNCCSNNTGVSNFRVSNLALNSNPLDVLLGDGRVVYADVRYKETTAFKRIAPGAYQFFFAETSLTPMPTWMDIETLDSAWIGMYPVSTTVASLYLDVAINTTYTVFLLSSGTTTNAIQTMVVTLHSVEVNGTRFAVTAGLSF